MKQTPSTADTQTQPKLDAHAAADREVAQAETGAAGAGRTKKVLLWAIPLGIVILLAGAYVGGALYFQTTFLPGTTLDGEDVSLRPTSEVAQEKSSSLDDYQIHVTGKGLDLTVTAEQMGLTCDGDAYVGSALAQANPWAWPVELASTRDLTAEAPVSFDRQKLADVIAPAVEQLAAAATVEGHGISYSAERAAFVIDEQALASRLNADLVTDVVASAIEADLVTDAVAAAIEAGETQVEIGDECAESDADVQAAIDAANALVSSTVSLTLAGTPVAEVDSARIAGWVTIGDDLSVSLNAAAIEEWTRGELSDQLDTVGKDRTYTRPDGVTFTVPGTDPSYGASTYGWSIDGAALAQQIATNVQAGQPSTIDIPCVQTAAQYNPGGQDWGDRYIDVDLTAQHAVFYDGGTVIWEAAITTGQPNLGQETPVGVWMITNRKSRATDGDINLKGPIDPATGLPEWDSHVDFWLGVVGNLVGFHNAPWQSTFGGNIYTYYGSHGCIRMSYESGQALYNAAQVGDVVVIHK